MVLVIVDRRVVFVVHDDGDCACGVCGVCWQ